MSADSRPYGTEDASFQAAGGVEGIRKLVDDFYDLMETRPDATRIRRMHPRDLEISRDKLARFMCGWLGGPKLFSEKYGPITIPGAHAHLDIGEAERDAWLLCMDRAVAEQPWSDDLKVYVMQQLAVPAERIRRVCSR